VREIPSDPAETLKALTSYTKYPAGTQTVKRVRAH
jgi:hypothetical protein